MGLIFRRWREEGIGSCDVQDFPASNTRQTGANRSVLTS